jgi:hypothetical protein
MDEHRLGLKPIVRRVWTPRGTPPIAVVHPRYEWLYVVGFVHPASGATAWLVAPGIDTQVFNVALAEFARTVGAGPTKRIVLVLDGAGWHVAGDVVVPDGVHLVALPPDSPELQPAERLWPLVDEPLVNQAPADLATLQATVVERCRALSDARDAVGALTNFHGWPRAA